LLPTAKVVDTMKKGHKINFKNIIGIISYKIQFVLEVCLESVGTVLHVALFMVHPVLSSYELIFYFINLQFFQNFYLVSLLKMTVQTGFAADT
jgi:hypothetical protein